MIILWISIIIAGLWISIIRWFIDIHNYTPAPPKVEWGYTEFTLMYVRPSVRPSVEKVSLTGIILDMGSGYIVTSSLIGRANTQNDLRVNNNPIKKK